MEHKTWKVYRFTFPDGKVYIGCTCQELKDRCKMKNYKGMPVYKAFSSFPKGSWQLDLLSVWDSEDAGYKAEVEAIELYGSTDPDKGYNRATGGKGAKGVKHTEEWKRRNGDLMRGRKRSPETIARIASKNRGRHLPQLTRENNGFYGKRHTPETLAVISAKSRAKVFTDEIRRHMGDGKRGRPKLRAVVCVESGMRYPTIKAASHITSINRSCISQAAHVPHHTAGGYHWRFDEAV